jgi:tetratricopeptide (TPR) repeat protein
MEMHDGGRRARMGSASRIACRGVAALAFASCAARAAPADVPVLVDGSRIERRLPGDAQDRLIVDASRGPLVVIVDQIGADLALRCDNEAHARNAPTGRWGPEVVVVDKACDLSIRARSIGTPTIAYRVRAFGFDSAEGRRLPPGIWKLWSQGHYDSGTEDTKGHTAALEKLRQVERAVVARGNGEDRRYLQYGNAHILRRMERYAEAIAAYDALTRGLDPKRHSVWFTRGSNGKGLALRELDRFEEADHAFADAERYGADRKDGYEWVSAKNNRCLILHHYGRLAEARDCYMAVIPLYREVAPNQVAIPMLNLAAAADTLGEPALALKNYRAALELRRAGTDRRSLAFVLLNLANHEAQTGAWPDALEHSLEAQNLFEALGDNSRMAAALTVRGWIYRELRELERARGYLEQAVDAAGKGGDPSATAMAQSALAELDPDDARAAASYRKAISYLAGTKQAGFAAEKSILLAERLDALRDGSGRDAALTEAEKLLHKGAARSSRARIATLRARVAMREDRFKDASALLAQAIALRQTTRETGELAAVRLLNARIERRAGREEPALAEIDKALAELQRAERLPSSPVLAANLFDRRVELIDEAMDILLGRPSPDDAALARAWAMKWKYSRLPAAPTAAPADAAERELLDELRSKVAALSGAERSGLQQRPGIEPPETHAAIARRVEEIESLLDARDAGARAPDVPAMSLAGVREALRAGEVVVGISLGSRTSGAWIVTSDAARWIALPSRKATFDATTAVLATLDNDAFDALSRALSPLIAATAKARRVLIVPDGPTHLIPFAALRVDADRYWIDRSSITLLAGPPMVPGQLRPVSLAKGFPVVVWGASGEEEIAVSGEVMRSGALLSLPALSVERRLIERALGKRRVSSGDPRAAQTPSIDSAWMLHVAGHGIADSRHPYASALALEGGAGDGTDFTTMSARSVRFGKKLPSVIFVNVCDGLAGRIYESQPPSSLAREFLDTGAGVVIAASWPIEDSRAARFAESVYRELESNADDIAEALARAQRAAAHGRFGRLQRHWSGYSLVRGGG